MHKVVLITGASRGIGAATALLAAQQGWAVAVNYVANSLAADDVVRQIRAAGRKPMFFCKDVRATCGAQEGNDTTESAYYPCSSITMKILTVDTTLTSST